MKRILAGFCLAAFAALPALAAQTNSATATAVYARSFNQKAWWTFTLGLDKNPPSLKDTTFDYTKMVTTPKVTGDFVDVEGKVSADGKRIDMRLVALVSVRDGKMTVTPVTGKLYDQDGKEGVRVAKLQSGSDDKVFNQVVWRSVGAGRKFRVEYTAVGGKGF